jgi:hypothetical protein
MANWLQDLQEETAMSTEAVLTQPDVPDNASALTDGYPKWARLNPEEALQPCDGHAGASVSALVLMILASGNTVVLCGNCARRAGYEHTRTSPEENRQKGSDH